MPSSKFVEVTTADFSDIALLSCLSLSDLSTIESAQRSVFNVVSTSSSWRVGVARDFLPQFKMNDKMIAKLGNRREVFELSMGLKSVDVAGSVPVPLPDVEHAKKMIVAIQRAELRNSRHLATGGSTASAVVGIFKFSREALIEAVSRKAGKVACASDPMVLTLPNINGVSPQHVCLTLQWNGETMSVAVDTCHGWGGSDHTDESAQRARERVLSVDVHGVCSQIALSLVDFKVLPDGKPRKAEGLCSRIGKVDMFADALSSGLSCVVAVRDCNLNSLHDHSLASTLHLEQVRSN